MEVHSKMNETRHLVDLLDRDRDWVRELFHSADRLRARRGTPKAPRPLAGKTAALVFHKPILRTRVVHGRHARAGR
jgi:ornithine carbamoyltransferase